LAREWIEARERLIEEHKLSLLRQAQGERDLRALPAREPPDGTIERNVKMPKTLADEMVVPPRIQ
jgi:hypothetical protein